MGASQVQGVASLDYVIVHRHDVSDVKIMRAMQGAEYWTDHRLVILPLSLHITPPQ